MQNEAATGPTETFFIAVAELATKALNALPEALPALGILAGVVLVWLSIQAIARRAVK